MMQGNTNNISSSITYLESGSSSMPPPSPQELLPLDKLWPASDLLDEQYFDDLFVQDLSSSSLLSPQSSNPQLQPQVAAKKPRGRLPKKKNESKNNNASNKKKNNSSGSSSSSRTRVVSERERRKVLGNSIVTLRELLPVRCCRSTTLKMDKCTVLKEAYAHILNLQEELEALAKKKEELLIISSPKAVESQYNGSKSVMADEVKTFSNIDDCEKEDGMECCNKRGEMFQQVVCDASNVFVTLQIPEGGGDVRLSRVVGTIQKANVDIINAVFSWPNRKDPSFCLLAHGKVQIGASSSSIQALKEDLCTISIPS